MFQAASIFADLLHGGWLHIATAVVFTLHIMRETVSLIMIVIKNLPAIIALVKTIVADINSYENERTVKDDLKAITEAINAKDANKVNAIFNAPAGVVQPVTTLETKH